MTSLPDRPTTAPAEQVRIDRDLDRALRTLSFAVDASATTREPVVLRSVEVAMYLRDLGYGRDVQVAGLLHDLLKYTMYPLHDIAHDFGDEVSVLIMANTLDPTIEDLKEQYEEAFPRCLAWGESAGVIMAVSLLQETVDMDATGLAKARHFLELSEPLIGREPVWSRLEARTAAVAHTLSAGEGRS